MVVKVLCGVRSLDHLLLAHTQREKLKSNSVCFITVRWWLEKQEAMAHISVNWQCTLLCAVGIASPFNLPNDPGE